MPRVSPSSGWVAALAALALVACQQKSDPAADWPAFDDYPRLSAYQDTTSEHPHLVFADGSVSLNDQCPVRRAKLNRKMPPVYINGRPIGFC
ncbi:MAG: hypothetical protein IPK72_02380 [Candidatus Eisenbacteria bacterium]|nr:hypothetical protein [Candidatus Eisenbacteria bacterium]